MNTQLTPAERAVFTEVYPQLAAINERLGERIELLLLVNLARRLVTLGRDPDDLVALVRHHADNQREHNETRRTN